MIRKIMIYCVLVGYTQLHYAMSNDLQNNAQSCDILGSLSSESQIQVLDCLVQHDQLQDALDVLKNLRFVSKRWNAILDGNQISVLYSVLDSIIIRNLIQHTKFKKGNLTNQQQWHITNVAIEIALGLGKQAKQWLNKTGIYALPVALTQKLLSELTRKKENEHMYMMRTRALIALGADINEGHQNLATPLHLAVKNNDYPVAKLLVTHGALVNAQQLDGQTPLHIASATNNLKMLRLLLERNASVSLTAR